MKYLNALNKIKGLGPKTFQRLFNHFETAEEIWQAGFNDLTNARVPEKLANTIIEERNNINPDEEWEILERENIQIIDFKNEKYPTLLKEIPNPPYVLYQKGDFDFNQEPAVAIVGSRKFSQYGKQVAYSFARDLAQAGITVISGLALGIDAIAHQGALAGHGKTVAVLGNSLDNKNLYPPSHFSLSKKITQNGALISDYPVPTPAGKNTFPARNRIMAGLTLGTLVVEAAEKSGSLITANLAINFNREVFAVPGNIFSEQSAGTNSLIKRGAKLITSVQDVLEELNLEKIKTENKIKKTIPASPEEEKILKILSTDPLHIDKIVKHSKLRINVVSSLLSILEMKGIIKNIGGHNYIIL